MHTWFVEASTRCGSGRLTRETRKNANTQHPPHPPTPCPGLQAPPLLPLLCCSMGGKNYTCAVCDRLPRSQPVHRSQCRSKECRRLPQMMQTERNVGEFAPNAGARKHVFPPRRCFHRERTSYLPVFTVQVLVEQGGVIAPGSGRPAAPCVSTLSVALGLSWGLGGGPSQEPTAASDKQSTALGRQVTRLAQAGGELREPSRALQAEDREASPTICLSTRPGSKRKLQKKVIVAQPGRRHPVWVLVRVPALPLPNQLPANAPRKAAENGPKYLAPATHVGDLDGVPGSRLQPG